MTDLETFRDHCRKMSTAEHSVDCGASIADRWGWIWVTPDPDCGGCVSDGDRALFARLADEVDAYLAVDEEPGLFEEEAG